MLKVMLWLFGTPVVLIVIGVVWLGALMVLVQMLRGV
jgi:hypothetical protein